MQIKPDPSKIRCIATDIDGTLLTDQKVIHPEIQACLIDLQRQGIRLVLASGRMVSGMMDYARALEMEKHGGVLIAVNGGILYDCSKKQTVLHRTIPKNLAMSYLKAWDVQGISRFCYGDGVLYTNRENKDGERIDYALKINKLDLVLLDDLSIDLPEDPQKLLITGQDMTRVHALEPQVRAQFEDRLYMAYALPEIFEAVEKGIDKGRGLKDLADHYALDLSEIMAFGDGENDAPLLKTAGFGVAMANGSHMAKEAADAVTLSNNEQGMSHYLRSIGLWNPR